ncbi:glutamine ABC transporter permease GlnP [Paraburkholderia sp.]|uniref:glutamine ABC transporter permease GlnP n=1 Tax=Paraburkholderia sp. TaxID=1926495 RepID=UPI003C4802B6
MDFDFSVIWQSLPELLKGARLTILIATLGLAGGLVIGVIVGSLRAYGVSWSRKLCLFYIELVRGTPLIVQVMFIYFALPLIANIRVDPLVAAVAAIIFNAGAYIAEIVRGAFISISKSLTEAGHALGLPFWKVLVYIIGPLAFRRMVPALGNQFIIGLKDTSLFIVIGVGELTRQGQEIMAVNFRAVEIWTTVAVIYLLMIEILTIGLRVLENKMVKV